MQRRMRNLSWVVSLALGLLAGCGDGEPELKGEPRCDSLTLDAPALDANVVLVVDDTLRRDAVGLHGGSASTPHLDRLGRQHLVFQHAYAQAPWTKPSIATLFTSLYPSQHRVASDPQMRSDKERAGPLQAVDTLADSFVTLAEVLGEAGLRSAAFVANPWIEGRFGFAQGFDPYDDSAAAWSASGETAVDAALAWLAQRGPDERFFLYLHVLESHQPYGHISSAEVSEIRKRLNADPNRLGVEGQAILKELRLSDGTPLRAAGFIATRALIREVYRRGVENFDRLLGRLLEGLEQHPSWDRTAVLVTSDHGEALFERGYGTHGHGLYDDEAAVPLIARLPGVSPARAEVDCVVGLVDVMPSLCAYLGALCPTDIAGWSFLRTGDGPLEGGRRFLATEGVMKNPAHRSIRNRSYKLMYEPRGQRDGRKKLTPYSLFRLADDPGERLDHLEEFGDAERTQRALARLKPALHSAVSEREAPSSERIPIDPQLRQRLQNLGYLED